MARQTVLASAEKYLDYKRVWAHDGVVCGFIANWHQAIKNLLETFKYADVGQ
jgi:hypothetical protein